MRFLHSVLFVNFTDCIKNNFYLEPCEGVKMCAFFSRVTGYICAVGRIFKRHCAFVLYRREHKNNTGKVLIYDTSISTNNSGDFIIMDYCNKIIQNCLKCNFDYLSTHKPITTALTKDCCYDKQIVCGTNLLFPRMDRQGHWNYPFEYKYLDQLCLLGVGWYAYDDTEISKFSQKWYRTVLNNGNLHSVRDSYTEQKLKSIGIENVINTSCPTMWNLTGDFCKQIPSSKANAVITTLTDYRKNPDVDKYMLQVLSKLYDVVYIWLQGTGDFEYLSTLISNVDDYKLIPFDLNEYDKVLQNEDVDYVGTRLHAGIRALNHCKRSIIIAVDNRAIEIAKDTNLPVMKREAVKLCLEKRILSTFSTNIKLPVEKIELWKSQFSDEQ